MKKFAASLAMLLSVFVVAACGSSSDDEVTPENLAAAMDGVCAENDALYTDLGTRGFTNQAIALEFEGYAEARQANVDRLNELNVDDAARKDLDRYIAASEKAIATDRAVVKAAESGDDEAVNEAFEAQNPAFDARDKLADELGLKVCGQDREIELEETGTAPPEDLNYAEPKNTVEEAAEAYVGSVTAGNCNEQRHTDAGEVKPKDCATMKANFEGAKVEGAEQYGPVGMAEIVNGEGTHFPSYFVNDLDGELRFAGDTIHDFGGLRKAPADNDADQVADDLVAAIRDDDVEAFNATLPDSDVGFYIKDGDSVDDFSDGKYSDAFLADIRDGDAEPVQLGINAAYGFYFMEGSEYDWVIALVHVPGGGSHYGFQGYYPIPKA